MDWFESSEEFIQNLVDSMSRLIPTGHVTYNEMYPQEPRSCNWANVKELVNEKACRLWERHMNEHPVMRHILETNDRRAVRISDFWSRRQLHDRGLYHDFYRLYDIEDALCITVPCELPVVIGAGWHRDRCFTGRERLMANLAIPHITQAWQNVRLLAGMRSQLQLLNQGLADAHSGAVACDADGHVHFMTASARRYLCEYFAGGGNADHHLPPDLLCWVRRQHAQLEQTDDAPSVRRPLMVQKGERRLTVRLLSAPEPQGARVSILQQAARARSLLLLEEETSGAPVEAAASSIGDRPPDMALPICATPDDFGLSRRECEVLNWVAQGKTNGEIATILGAKPATVRKHLEHIFQKLGVGNRTAAAAVALQPSTMGGWRHGAPR